jgi:hypothetical protein
LIQFESCFADRVPWSCATFAATAAPVRGVGIGTGVNAAAGPLIARTASTVSAIPLLTIRFISDAPISQPVGCGIAVLSRYGATSEAVLGGGVPVATRRNARSMALRMPCSSRPLGTPGARRLNRVAKPGLGTATLTTGASTGGPTTPRAERRERLRGGSQPGRDLVAAASASGSTVARAHAFRSAGISPRGTFPRGSVTGVRLRLACFRTGLLAAGLLGSGLIAWPLPLFSQ